MRSHHLQISILLALPAALCSPVPHSHPPPLPLVIWHGLGDTFSNPGLQSIADIYTSLYPTAQTHIISLASSPSSDRTATFLGHLPTQLQAVCDALLDLPAPFSTSRLNLLGLSQGGQFLRALVQTCPLPHPPATLMTLGSQHNGISRFLAKCSPGDWTCKSTTALLERNKWSNWSQHNLVPAQYFRDPADLDSYLTYSGFLADVNNERAESRNATFADRLSSLDRFVMYVFGDDKTVWPKESGWFDEVEDREEEGERTVVKLREREMYKEDWLGLRKLDEKGGLIFGTLKGEHMRLEDDDLKEMFRKYYYPSKKGEKQKEEEKQEEENQREEKGGEEEL